MPGGRPSKYDKKYCLMLIKHCKQGLSFETFGTNIGVHRDTLHEWAKKHKEFSDAKKMALDHSQMFWEKYGLENMENRDFNAAMWIFTMKCRFKYDDGASDKKSGFRKRYPKK